MPSKICFKLSQTCFTFARNRFRIFPIIGPNTFVQSATKIVWSQSSSFCRCFLISSDLVPIATARPTSAEISNGIQLPVIRLSAIPTPIIPTSSVASASFVNCPVVIHSYIDTARSPRLVISKPIAPPVVPNASVSPATAAVIPRTISLKLPQLIPFCHASNQLNAYIAAPPTAKAMPAILLKSSVKWLAIFQAKKPAPIASTSSAISRSVPSSSTPPSKSLKSGAMMPVPNSPTSISVSPKRFISSNPARLFVASFAASPTESMALA